MSETAAMDPPPATPAVRGTLHRFLPLPVMQHHAQWFEAGPVSFALEMRAQMRGSAGTSPGSHRPSAGGGTTLCHAVISEPAAAASSFQ